MKKQILDLIESKQLKVGVVGLGYAGLPIALRFADAGFSVLGIDKDEDKVGTDGEVAETDEVEEDSAKDIEDEVLAKGEPKDVEDKAGDKVSDDPEITAEVPAEADEVEDEEGVEVAAEEEETPAATKRIMAFEDFIKEKEVTINKNVKYHDDDEEKEDYSVVAASADAISEDDEEEGKDDEKKGDELEDKGDKKVDSEDDKEKEDHYKGAVKSDDSEIDALKKDVKYDKEEEEEDDDDDDDDKNESRIMSFSNFVTEAYDVDEDRADDIEDELKKKGTPKSLEEEKMHDIDRPITLEDLTNPDKN